MPPPENNSLGHSRGNAIWLVVWLLALATRLAATLVLPNAELDGYSYVETIARWSGKLRAGDFHFTDLFGFWLPLFQFVAAIFNIGIHNPLLVAKIISAIAGSISCVLVFVLVEKLTRNVLLGCAAFAVVLCNPFHILYSAAAMTDLPFICLVLASLYFVFDQRWIVAAIFAALAGCVRLEGWTFIVLFPLIQFLRERRISLVSLSILLLPLLGWLAINQIATGDPFAYFAARAQYHASFLDFYPSRHGFAWKDIRTDIDAFLLGANSIALLAIAAATTSSIFYWRGKSPRFDWRVLAIAACACAIFVFLLAAYVTKRQPIILARYALIFFVLGLLLLAWLLRPLVEKSFRGKLIAACVFALCLFESKAQFPTIPKVIADFHAQQQIASKLVRIIQQSRCFSDDPAVHVLSGLPPATFVRTQTTPASATANADAFRSYLRENHVGYLVFMRMENSLPEKLFPELGRDPKIDIEHFQLIDVAFSPFGPDIWLYRLAD